jgi:hypothetical protein
MRKRVLSLITALLIILTFVPYAESAVITASTSQVYINNKAVTFSVYSIAGNSYFKLRDLAYSLNGTEKQFDASLNSAGNAINLTTGTAYTAVGGEMSIGDNAVRRVANNTTRIYLDGREVTLDAVTINGSNHFRLLDIARILDFSAEWNNAVGAIMIDTSRSFRASAVTAAPPFLMLTNESGEFLDILTLSLDGVRQKQPLNGTFRSGRMWINSAQFSAALGLPAGDNSVKSLFELCEQLGLSVFIDRTAGIIELYTGNKKPERLPISGERHAVIRLEDVAAFGDYAQRDELIKMRATADLLYKNNAAFSIAWIPVFVRPADSYKNDPRDYTRYNLEFVFTFDYMISRGGELGLHGYTHQRGNEMSISGIEFGPGVSDAVTRRLMQQQVKAAEDLGWKAHSFTFPKYVGTASQHAIAGEYFDVIWPNRHSSGTISHIKIGQRNVIYFNTPQDHLVGRSEADLAALLRRLDNAGEIANFFFHCHLEYAFITISRDQRGFPVISYDTNSPLHRILDNLRANGRTLRSVTHFQR